MEEIKFVEGLFVNEKKNAPDFVNAKISINAKFIEWYEANKNEKGYVNIDILTSREGKMYAKHNDWKPDGQAPQGTTRVQGTTTFEPSDDLPF
jgi:hypothetical protein